MKKKDIKKIIVDGNQKLNYSGFYLAGIRELFKKQVVIAYSFEGANDKEHSMAFKIVRIDNTEMNIIIDFHDSMRIDKAGMKWCHHYFKINYNTTYLRSNYHTTEIEKMKLIPPSFGIRVFTLPQTIAFISGALLHWNRQTVHTVKNALRAYVKRLPLSYYKPEAPRSNYIFFTGSIWNKADSMKITLQRAEIIRAIKKVANKHQLNFEGGLVNIGYACDYIPDINDLMFAQTKISLREYLRKTKRSVFAFNNPAVQDCHGWKIAEFMAMGKAVLSYTAVNDVDELMMEYNAVKYVASEENLIQAMHKLIENEDERIAMEIRATEYWENCMSPSAVLTRIFESIE